MSNVVLCAGIAVVFSLAVWGTRGAQAVEPVADIARGRHLATVVAGCADCHGENFAGGRAFVRSGVNVRAANLTAGAGGIGGVNDADLRRAIRAGIAPDGTRLLVMPASAYAVMTDADVDDLIAFLRSVPPVDNVIARTSALPAASPPARMESAQALDAPSSLTGGAYLVRIASCTGCHGARLAGGVSPSGAAVPNISHDGIGSWTFADFTTAMRTGKTPDGHVLSAAMPWRSRGNMTDDELHLIYDYLESVSQREIRSDPSASRS